MLYFDSTWIRHAKMVKKDRFSIPSSLGAPSDSWSEFQKKKNYTENSDNLYIIG